MWSHEGPIDKLKSKTQTHSNYSTHYDDYYNFKHELSNSLNKCLNDLQELLKKYGYIRNQGMPTQYYVGSISCNDEMKILIKKYKELDAKFTVLTSRLKSKEIEKEKAIAEDIWNRAE